MTPEQYERVREVYLAVRETVPTERTAFLDNACVGDGFVRSEVESLLASTEKADTFLGTPILGKGFAVDDPALHAPSEQGTGLNVAEKHDETGGRAHPLRLGQYQILDVLGEGGMGVVYEALQEQPHRRVAIKVIKSQGAADAFHVRLFQREVEALARLKHPGIAAIYDAGHTEDGRHFFAMELIRGETLLDYANARTSGGSQRVLSTRERLNLFCKTCDAINYAHQRGVTHRDLKPSNILISDEGTSGGVGRSGRFGGSSASAGFSSVGAEVKVLDFGLARITDSDVSQTTLLTKTGSACVARHTVGTLTLWPRASANSASVMSGVRRINVLSRSRSSSLSLLLLGSRSGSGASEPVSRRR